MRTLLRSLSFYLLVFTAHAQIVNPIGFLETDGFSSFEIASDGSVIYALDTDGITAFNRNNETGLLSEVNTAPFNRRGRYMQLTPDGRFIYAGGERALGLALYGRDFANNQLQLLNDDVLNINPDPLMPEWTTQYVSLSHDGNTIYAILFSIDPDFENNPVRLQIYSRDSNDGSATLVQTIVFDEGPLGSRLPFALFTTPDNRHLYLQHSNANHFIYRIGNDGRLTFLRQGSFIFRNGAFLPIDISTDSERIFVFDHGPPTSPPSPKHMFVLNRAAASGELTAGPGIILSPSFFGPNVDDQSANALLADERLLILSDTRIFRLNGNNSQPILLPENEFTNNPLASRRPFTMIASPDEQHLYYSYENGIAIFEFNGTLPPAAIPVPGLQRYTMGLLVLLLIFIGIYCGKFKGKINV